jgi:hypothetical protein
MREATARAEEVFTEAQLHTPPRPLTRRRAPAAFHPSIRCRRARTAVEHFTPANAIRLSQCVRRDLAGFATLLLIEAACRLPARVHSLRQASDNLVKLVVSRGLRITEIWPPQAYGTSETPEPSSGTEIISGMLTICEMETIIFALTGKNTFSLRAQGIGIGTGTVTTTIGGMVTDAASLMDRG